MSGDDTETKPVTKREIRRSRLIGVCYATTGVHGLYVPLPGFAIPRSSESTSSRAPPEPAVSVWCSTSRNSVIWHTGLAATWVN